MQQSLFSLLLVLAALLSAPSAASQTRLDWNLAASGTQESLRAVVFAEGTFVAVGDAGTVLTSTEASTWTPQMSQTSASLRAIAWGNGRFVAVGDSGTIVTSDDGVAWTVRRDTGRRLNGITHGGSRFMAVGDRGAVLTSLDGTDWIECDSGTQRSLFGIVYLALYAPSERFLLVGERGTLIATVNGSHFRNYAESFNPPYSTLITGNFSGCSVISRPLLGYEVVVAYGARGAVTSALQDDFSAAGYEFWQSEVPIVPGERIDWRGSVTIGKRVVLVGAAGSVATQEYNLELEAAVHWPTPTEVDLNSAAKGPEHLVVVGEKGLIMTRPLLFPSTEASGIKRPQITQQRVPGPPATAERLTLSVAASRPAGATSYQWYWISPTDAVPSAITGANQPDHVIDPNDTTKAGRYACVITTDRGPVTTPLAYVDISPPTLKSGFCNVSVRSFIGEDEPILIAGYTTTNPRSEQTLVRGIGPGLAAFNVRDALPDPIIKIHSSEGELVVENDQWMDNPWATGAADAWASHGAFPLAPASNDAACIQWAAPGSYTASLTSKPGASGSALIEIFSRSLSNISARGECGGSRPPLILGIVIETAPIRILFRGIGPSLLAYGLKSPLADPRIELFDHSGRMIAANDDWSGATDLSNASTKTGAFALPVNSKDAALLTTLAPGTYTLHLTSDGERTGTALIEAYIVP